MSTGIYCYENIINKKKYIGQSQNIERRQKEHETLLKNGFWKGRENSHFKKAVEKYGRENFIFYILEECEIKNLDEKEIYWINKLKNQMCPSAFCTGGLKETTLENGQKVMQCDYCTYHIDIDDL